MVACPEARCRIFTDQSRRYAATKAGIWRSPGETPDLPRIASIPPRDKASAKDRNSEWTAASIARLERVLSCDCGDRGAGRHHDEMIAEIASDDISWTIPGSFFGMHHQSPAAYIHENVRRPADSLMRIDIPHARRWVVPRGAGPSACGSTSRTDVLLVGNCLLHGHMGRHHIDVGVVHDPQRTRHDDRDEEGCAAKDHSVRTLVFRGPYVQEVDKLHD